VKGLTGAEFARLLCNTMSRNDLAFKILTTKNLAAGWAVPSI
jgi:hypothetical protein